MIYIALNTDANKLTKQNQRTKNKTMIETKQTTRVFGGKEDNNFWSDKPLQYGHPNFKTKWYHVHWYNIPFNPIHFSPDRTISEEMNVIGFFKCRCGKIKP